MLRSSAAALAALFMLASPVDAAGHKSTTSAPKPSWVAVHRETGLWSGPDDQATLFAMVRPGTRLRVAAPQNGPRLYVWDPQSKNYAYIEAADVGPTDPPSRDEQRADPPAESARGDPQVSAEQIIWGGVARVTMYSCTELGGCSRTALGIWPYEGVVAVDPRLIPLGSTVWVEGLGIFLAADTGSAVRGSHVDVFVNDYWRARNWGVQYLQVMAYRP